MKSPRVLPSPPTFTHHEVTTTVGPHNLARTELLQPHHSGRWPDDYRTDIASSRCGCGLPADVYQDQLAQEVLVGRLPHDRCYGTDNLSDLPSGDANETYIDLLHWYHGSGHFGNPAVWMGQTCLGPHSISGTDGTQGKPSCNSCHRQLKANCLQGVNRRPDTIRPCFQHSQDVYSCILLSHRTGEVAFSKISVGNFRSCLCRIRRLFSNTVGAMHVRLRSYMTIVLPKLIVAAPSPAIGL